MEGKVYTYQFRTTRRKVGVQTIYRERTSRWKKVENIKM